MAKKLEIKLVRSTICTPEWMRVVVRTLGLKKMNQVTRLPDTPATWGQIKQVPHLLSVKSVEE
jgi:large subunit ribosomal protein L30